MRSSRFNLVFLFPQVYRPLKENVARRFHLLADRCSGHIFTLSGNSYRELKIATFGFHSAIASTSLLCRWVNYVRVQILWPIWLLLRRQRTDVIVAYDPYSSGFAGTVLKPILRSKLIVELNGDYHAYQPSQNVFKKSLMHLLLLFSLRNADAVKVLNTSQEDYARALSPTTTTYRFPDFTAVGFFQGLATYQGDYLLSIGYPFHIKGMDILIQAFQRICRKHPTKTLRIMGYCSGNELVHYKRLADNNPRIEFIPPGWIEDVGEQMRGCYALVNAARTEALGRVHIEAMACGKPIVATTTNGAVECVEDGRTGLLCRVGDVEGLAEKLDYLLSNPDIATQMGAAGFRRMRDRFSEERYLQAFLRMLEEVTHTN